MRKIHPIDFVGNIVHILTATSSMNKNIAAVAGKAMRLMEAEAWSLILDESFFKTVKLRSSKNIQRINFKVVGGIAGLAMTKEIPVNVANVSLNRHFDKNIDGFRDLRIISLIYAPLKIKDRAVGVLRFFRYFLLFGFAYAHMVLFLSGR